MAGQAGKMAANIPAVAGKLCRGKAKAEGFPWGYPKHFYVAGACLFTGMAYSTYKYLSAQSELLSARKAAGDPASGNVFDVLAEKYDQAIDTAEMSMLMFWARSATLKKHAEGKVLEISAGTGRNLPYYDYSKISHLTLTDVSKPMLEKAEVKFYETLRLGYKHPETKISFAVSDAHCILEPPQQESAPGSTTPSVWQRTWKAFSRQPESQQAAPHASSQQEEEQQSSKRPLPQLGGERGSLFNIFRALIPGGFDKKTEARDHPAFHEAHHFDEHVHEHGCCHVGKTDSGTFLKRFPPDSFDTVVDTFGLCSHANPVQVLKEAARICKPTGKIILIEHGRSSWWYRLNRYMDDRAEQHKKDWGCWWNRDIMSIVEQAGLIVEQKSEWHLGTTYIIIASPGVLPDGSKVATTNK